MLNLLLCISSLANTHMKKIILTLFVAGFAASAIAQTPQLVKDINTATVDSDPILLTNVNGIIFFFALKSFSTAHALWKSDGTGNGTVNVTSNSSFDYYPSSATPISGALGNQFYWAYNKSLNISDGTSAGTVTLKTFTYDILYVINAGSKLFIITYSGQTNLIGEVWISDGTAAGTKLLKTFSNPPPNSSLDYNFIYNPVVVNNNLMFFVYTATNAGACCQPYIWKSDGTVTGTVPLVTVTWTNPFAFQNKLYYLDGAGLYQTDENFTAPVLVNAVPYGLSLHLQTVQAGPYLYFTHGSNAVPNIGGDELWRTDGTNGGTIKLYTTPDGSEITNLTVANGNVYFVSGYKVYQSTGTVPGTTVMKDFSALVGGLLSYPTNLTASGTTLYFAAYTQTDNAELWKSDGTIGGTAQVNSTFSPGIDGLNPAYLVSLGASSVAFAGTGNTTGRELFSSDGTSVTNVIDIAAQPGSSSPGYITSSNNTIYFTATTTGSGMEMWQTDGTSGGTTMVLDVNPAGSSSPAEVVKSITDSVFWKAFDGVNVGLYNNSNRHLLQTFPVNDPAYLYMFPASIDNVLYFNGYDDAHGVELWTYSQGQAKRITDISPGTQYAYSSNYAKFNNEVFFYVNTISNAATNGLYKTDGTTSGTVLVKSFSSVSKLTVFNGVLYFYANDGVSGAELWSSDGTTGGTTLVMDINPGSGGSETSLSSFTDLLADHPVVYQNKLYFLVTIGVQTSLWTSDGTTAGTTHFVDNAGGDLTIVNDKLFFRGNGTLMVTDGTAAGTITLSNNYPYSVVPFNNYLIFDSAGPIKLTDGTADGTFTIATTNFPLWITAHQNTLYFSDNDNTHGRELWLMNMISPPTITSVTPDPANNLKFKIAGTNLSTAKAVLIGGVAPVSYTVVSNTEIDFVINNVSVLGLLRVNTTGGTTTTAFTYTAVPTITGISPDNGVVGTVVTITGTGFLGVTDVKFGGVPAQSFTIIDNSSIHATIGSNGASGSIAVTSPGGSTQGKKFQFYPVPSVTSLTPDHGLSGTAVTVIGNGFFNVSEVLVGSVVAIYNIVDSTKLTVNPTVGGVIKITATGGTVTTTNSFTVDQPVTAIENAANQEVAIFPNPADHYLRITYGDDSFKEQAVNIVICDMLGRQITTGGREMINQDINITNYGSGIYLVRIAVGGLTKVAKFVKQ